MFKFTTRLQISLVAFTVMSAINSGVASAAEFTSAFRMKCQNAQAEGIVHGDLGANEVDGGVGIEFTLPDKTTIDISSSYLAKERVIEDGKSLLQLIGTDSGYYYEPEQEAFVKSFLNGVLYDKYQFDTDNKNKMNRNAIVAMRVTLDQTGINGRFYIYLMDLPSTSTEMTKEQLYYSNYDSAFGNQGVTARLANPEYVPSHAQIIFDCVDYPVPDEPQLQLKKEGGLL